MRWRKRAKNPSSTMAQSAPKGPHIFRKYCLNAIYSFYGEAAGGRHEKMKEAEIRPLMQRGEKDHARPIGWWTFEAEELNIQIII